MASCVYIAHSSSVTPPTWSSTLPTLPSARAHVRTTPDIAIERYGALTQVQRSTGPMRRRGSSTATGTGCDRYVYLDEACDGSGSLGPAQRVCALEGSMRDPGCGPQETRRDADRAAYSSTAEADQKQQAPEVQTMYSLNMPVSTLRTKIRQEFERHRYVNQLKTVDVLLFNSHQEFQETLNFWKQLSHVLKYFRAEEEPKARLPANFINGFLEVRDRTRLTPAMSYAQVLTIHAGTQLSGHHSLELSQPGASSETRQRQRVYSFVTIPFPFSCANP
jgi:NADH dehydrogenase (ubiquinone) 1 alpha subcomplex subunit 6